MAYRIDNKTAVSALPPIDTSNVGEPGFFTGGDPATGLGATDVDADWLNSIQEEQLSVVEGAGLTPDKTNKGQMLQAIKKLIPAPVDTSGFATTSALNTAVLDEQQRAEQAEAALQSGYRLINRQVWSTGGSYTYTPTAGTRAIIVRLCGAGGGGAGANNNAGGYLTLGLGGNGGTYAETGILPVPAAPVSVSVGSGGLGGVPTATGGASPCYGSNGGVSSFGTIITCPGGPGAPVPSNIGSAPGMGAASVFTQPATGSVAWQSIGGAPPGWCTFGVYNTYPSFVFGSLGGSSFFGEGGAWGNASSGRTAQVPGAGGGAATSNGGPGGSGGNGADGIVIIEEYC